MRAVDITSGVRSQALPSGASLNRPEPPVYSTNAIWMHKFRSTENRKTKPDEMGLTVTRHY